MKTIQLALTAAVLLATSPLLVAQGTYKQIDFPGALDTFASGIDSAGDIVGSYVDSSFNYHGYLLSSNGTATTIDYPGATYTSPVGINDQGKIAGFAVGKTQAVVWGFLYDVATQTFTTLSDPTGGKTEPSAINNTGWIGGTVYPMTGPFAFSLIGNTYRLLKPPGTVNSSMVGITEAGGFVVEGGTSSNTTLYFSYLNGTFTQITLPSKPTIFIFGVNPAGTVYVGAYQNNVNSAYGYVYQPAKKIFTTLNYPNSQVTNAEAINRTGTVVGIFTDSSNNQHAFTWTP